jgi:hypothetical protein
VKGRPELLGMEDVPVLMHRDEFAFLWLSRESWTEGEVADLTLAIDYSFDGLPPVRCRRIEWNVYAGAEFENQ